MAGCPTPDSPDYPGVARSTEPDCPDYPGGDEPDYPGATSLS